MSSNCNKKKLLKKITKSALKKSNGNVSSQVSNCGTLEKKNNKIYD